jgi:hypothetical protein
VFESAKKGSLWPLQLVINELDPTIRFLPENIITVGFWFGEDPPMAIFWKPFTTEMRDNNKFEITENDTSVKFKIIPINCSVDTVARDMIQAKQSFNGAYGCSFCLHPGVNIYNDKERRNVQLGRKSQQINKNAKAFNETRYPYISDIDLRDHDSAVRDMTIAHLAPNVKHVNGFKELSPLVAIEDFNVIWGFGIDYMHNCLLGVTKLLLDLWFNPNYHTHPFYIGLYVQNVDKKLLSIKHTNNISRKTSSIADRHFWKANQFRSWLLYYGVASLHGTLLPKYLEHFALFSSAVYILLKSAITPEDMMIAREKLSTFTKNFEVLYGPINNTYNVHMVSHLCDSVYYCGPLWAFSCFHFEDNNGILSGYVKGTRHPLKQITSKHSLNKYASDCSNFESDKISKFNDVLLAKRHVKNPLQIDNTCGVGKMKAHYFDDEEKRACAASFNLQPTSAESFKRVIYLHDVYTTTEYSEKFKMDNSHVELRDGTFGRIETIFVLQNVFYLSLSNEFEKIYNFFTDHCPHLTVLKRKTRNILVVPITEIKNKCIVVKNDSIVIVTIVPNKFERD